ncbi:SDR family oxidoreductase [Parasphingopyxis algicola]|uniref:SDR family NAD(P)-dependent oxidoreductase n=1 Tax=Parasphingopyxis algicola TaxID=2026624 RepID=UPI0015A0CD4C|nr:SDR family NAD(P)-dependent oxidoreductase [Parasphingopyxis algicola]QLC26493.1 SDR family oxidoreductase [Parasphingopyxis algicola]
MDLTKRFAGKTCIVTGSGGSIGRATALRLAAEGANIVGCDVVAEGAAETVRLVEEAGGAILSVHPADLTEKAQCERVVGEALDRFGGVDVLFNNGAMAYFAWIDEMDDETWTKTIHEELDIVFLMTRAAWPELVKSEGAIVNVASLSAWAGIELLPALAHTAAKGGVLSMTRQLAMEGRKHGIRANSVSPGTILTNQTQFIKDDPEWSRIQLGRAMMNRMGEPEEVAGAVAFLASEDASYVTGADLRVDGGVLAW